MHKKNIFPICVNCTPAVQYQMAGPFDELVFSISVFRKLLLHRCVSVQKISREAVDVMDFQRFQFVAPGGLEEKSEFIEQCLLLSLSAY